MDKIDPAALWLIIIPIGALIWATAGYMVVQTFCSAREYLQDFRDRQRIRKEWAP